MVITANPPKFDKRQPSRGDYDAIVYIDGSQVIAEDSNGRKIASGVAGTDDAAVINSVLMVAVSGYVIKFGKGAFVINSALTIPSNTPVSVVGSGFGTMFITPASSANVIFSGVSVYKCIFTDFAISSGVGSTGNLFDFQNSAIHCLFDHLYIRDIAVGGYAINIKKGSGTSSPYENIITRCSCNCLSGYAGTTYVLYYAGSELYIYGNKFANSAIRLGGSGYANIYDNIFENASLVAESSTVLKMCDNQFSCSGASMTGVKCITVYNYVDAIVCNNCIVGGGYALDGIALTGSTSNSTFIGNIVTGCMNGLKEYGTNNFNIIAENNFGGNTNPLIKVGANDVVKDNIGRIVPGESRSASGLLTAGSADAIAFAWHNPELQDILVKKVTIRITTPGGTAGSLLDVGIADDAAGTNLGTEFFDDVDLNTAAIVKSTVATPGTQTVEVFCRDSVSATDGWIVGQILVADAASLVGSYYIEYEGA